MKLKLQRFEPCPVIQQYGPFDPPEIAHFKRAHLICMGPYHNDKWYIFYPKPKTNRQSLPAPTPAPVPPPAPRTLCEKVCSFIDKIVRG